VSRGLGRRDERRDDIRAHAARLLGEAGVRAPPLAPERCVGARRLRLADGDLAAVLRDLGVRPPARQRLDAMLDVPERTVWLRGGLHRQQRRFATLHEVGHDALPWQREVLYYCSLFDLPPATQREWEREASRFAAECLFLAGRFEAEARALPFGLPAAVRLAERYDASFEAALRHYVEHQDRPCCLVVSRAAGGAETPAGRPAPARYETAYYVASPSAAFAVAPGRRFELAELGVEPVLRRSLDEVVDHECRLRGTAVYGCFAQSFTNSYRLFTLLSPTPFPVAGPPAAGLETRRGSRAHAP
jgi:hypothetical protein